MPFIVNQPRSSGCQTCDRLRAATEGKVKYCVRHNLTVSAEVKKRYEVSCELLKEMQKNIKPRETRVTSEFANLFGEIR